MRVNTSSSRLGYRMGTPHATKMEPNSAPWRAFQEETIEHSRRRHDLAHKLGAHAPLDDPAAIALTKHCWDWLHDGDGAWLQGFHQGILRHLALNLRHGGVEEDGEAWDEAMGMASFFFFGGDWGGDGQQCSRLKARAQQHRAVCHAQAKDEEDQILRTLCAAALPTSTYQPAAN